MWSSEFADCECPVGDIRQLECSAFCCRIGQFYFLVLFFGIYRNQRLSALHPGQIHPNRIGIFPVKDKLAIVGPFQAAAVSQFVCPLHIQEKTLVRVPEGIMAAQLFGETMIVSRRSCKAFWQGFCGELSRTAQDKLFAYCVYCICSLPYLLIADFACKMVILV